MQTIDIDKAPGHWLLAQMGKKVLRPGGRELTEQLVENLAINPDSNVVELAPGLGFTASLVLKRHPHFYTGVEMDEEAAKMLAQKFDSSNVNIVTGNASQSNLPASSFNRVYGEAMLTMQADHRKSEIIREAYRLLEPGGRYGIHELGLTPDDLHEETKATIQKDLAKSIKVNARPLTCREWQELLEQEGFAIEHVATNLMHLLKYSRMVADEGLFRTLKIGYNILANTQARRRVMNMQRDFKKYDQNMNAVAIIAKKKTA